MNILVYDVAAEDGGGLFVLKNFYKEAMEKIYSDIKWTFLVSVGDLEEKKNIRILKVAKIKCSWFHRLYFEYFKLPKILKDLNPDLVISLQNMPISRCTYRQFVYLHQSLQFCSKQFSFFKKSERTLAFRQHIICNFLYRRGLPKAERIFVQTEWMKRATQKWLAYPEERIKVVPVSFELPENKLSANRNRNIRTFFYPARSEIYKNHRVVIEAVKILIEQKNKNFKVIFTIMPDEGNYSKELYNLSKGLPIEFIGNVNHDDIWEMYRNTILIFPSYLETCGIPLLEAKAMGGEIVASDLPF